LSRLLQPAAKLFAMLIVANAILAIFAVAFFGSLRAAWANLQGDPVLVTPGVVNVGRRAPLDQGHFVVAVTNLSSDAVRIVGAKYDCTCTMATQLPLTIPANESRNMMFAVRWPRLPGFFAQKAHILVEHGDLRAIRIQYTGRAVAAD
jgi:hypothetical protein